MRRLRLVAVPLFLFALIITFASCSNIQKLYDKGNYRQVVEKVEKMSSPSQSDLLLQARSFINLGQEEKALESVLIYLLSDDGKDPQGREFAVSIFLDTNTSDRIATMVLDADDGLRARMTSLIRSFLTRSSKEAMRSWSGPIPSSGAMTPPSTWKRPWYSWEFSMVATSCGCSTTQIMLLSLVASPHTGQGSCSVHAPQTEQGCMRC